MAEHHEEKTGPFIELLEAAEHVGGDGRHIAGLDVEMAIVLVRPEEEPPLAGMDDESLGRQVAVLGIGAAEGLAGSPDIEAVRFGDMHHLRRVLRDARPDDGEISFWSEPGVRASMKALRRPLRSA